MKVRARSVLLGVLVLMGLGLLGAFAAWRAAPDWAADAKLLALERAGVEDDAAYRRKKARIDADEAFWSAHPLLQPVDGGDAEPLLTRFIRWEKDKTQAPYIPEALTAAMRTPDGGWAYRFAEFDAGGVDLSWMASLGSYGTWDLDSPTSPSSQGWRSFPEGIDLVGVAKTRLVQGLKHGDAREAAQQVRELARLCLTSERLLVHVYALGLLNEERSAFQAAQAAGQPVDGWSPIDERSVHTLKQLLFMAQAPSGLWAGPDVAAAHFPVGACAGLAESLGVAVTLHAFLADEYPQRFKALGDLLRASPCRLRRLREVWAVLEAGGRFQDVNGTTDAGVDPRTLPASQRRLAGATLGAMARSLSSSWFADYGK